MADSSVQRLGYGYYCRACRTARKASERDRYKTKNRLKADNPDRLELTHLSRCYGCGKTKPPEHFHRNLSTKSGRNGVCVPCQIYIRARYRAKEISVPFSIEREDVIIPEVCPVLGIPIILDSGRLNGGMQCHNSPTLDRLIPELGYVRGNVQIISWRANDLKRDCIDPEAFERIAAYLRLNLPNVPKCSKSLDSKD